MIFVWTCLYFSITIALQFKLNYIGHRGLNHLEPIIIDSEIGIDSSNVELLLNYFNDLKKNRQNYLVNIERKDKSYCQFYSYSLDDEAICNIFEFINSPNKIKKLLEEKDLKIREIRFRKKILRNQIYLLRKALRSKDISEDERQKTRDAKTLIEDEFIKLQEEVRNLDDYFNDQFKDVYDVLTFHKIVLQRPVIFIQENDNLIDNGNIKILKFLLIIAKCKKNNWKVLENIYNLCEKYKSMIKTASIEKYKSFITDHSLVRTKFIYTCFLNAKNLKQIDSVAIFRDILLEYIKKDEKFSTYDQKKLETLKLDDIFNCSSSMQSLINQILANLQCYDIQRAIFTEKEFELMEFLD